MSPLLLQDPDLPDDQVVYRTLDFFSATTIVNNQVLMFSRADTFSDKNEGIDRLLRQLQAAGPYSCGGMGWNNAETARRAHNQVKECHYISCWSRTAESVAMWSLYSPDNCSVRIATTIGKLRTAIENLIEKYSFANLKTSQIGSRVIVSLEGRIAPVTYDSIPEISRRIARRSKARKRLADRYERIGKPKLAHADVPTQHWVRELGRDYPALELQCNLKDISFKHEDEIRLVVRLGEETCRQSMLDEIPFLDPNHEYHIVLKAGLKVWGYIENSTLPAREFVSCPHDLIDTIAIDPRCPPHKANFIRSWFEDKKISVVQSSCFGYIPDSFEVYPDQ